MSKEPNEDEEQKAEYDETDVENLKQVVMDKMEENFKLDMIMKKS